MRWPLFIAQTPFPVIPEAKLYEDTWLRHILPDHPEMDGRVEAVKETVCKPLLVCSATAAGYYTFVSDTELDESGKPLIVVVTGPVAKDPFIVATSFYGNVQYRSLTQEKWPIQWRSK